MKKLIMCFCPVALLIAAVGWMPVMVTSHTPASGGSPTILTPTGAGPQTNATATGCVDLWDCVTDSSDATYITLIAGTYRYVTFTSTDTVPEGVIIDRVVVVGRSRSISISDATNYNLGANYRSNVFFAASYTEQDTYTVNGVWVVNPIDSSAFEKSDIDAIEFGVGVRTPHDNDVDVAELHAEVYWHYE